MVSGDVDTVVADNVFAAHVAGVGMPLTTNEMPDASDVPAYAAVMWDHLASLTEPAGVKQWSRLVPSAAMWNATCPGPV